MSNTVNYRYKYNTKFLYEIYKEFGGSLNAMETESRRLNLPYLPKQRETIKKIVVSEKFEGKYKQEQALQQELYVKVNRISKVKMLSIVKEGILKYSEGLKTKKYISEHGLKILWEIMKTELGEPILITKNENVNEDNFTLNVFKDVPPDQLELNPDEPIRTEEDLRKLCKNNYRIEKI